MIGNRIAHFEIIAKLGEGGMGEVFRATDTKLNREVALKILPEQFASDSQRMGRFQQEAEVLASLDHPNIGAIHGIEDVGETKALVLQLIEGPTLADRLDQGPLPVNEALTIALQIGGALEAAHGKGIIHRDLKPANIKVTPEGQIKVLDFGLAKALGEGSEANPVDSTQSPTLTTGATREGVILGTAAYMSPEQAAGQTVDRRSDIWSFGVVLFEMLAGKRPFAGETTSHTMAALLQQEPEWSDLPAAVPDAVRNLIWRCLQKKPEDRLRDIGDARFELDPVLAAPFGPGEDDTASRPRAASWRLWALPIGGLIVGLAAAWLWPVSGQEASEPRAVDVVLERPIFWGTRKRPGLALSPDGSILAYTAAVDPDSVAGISWSSLGWGAGNPSGQIVLRSLDDYRERPLQGTQGGFMPFFSSDGQWLAFVADGKLKKVSVSGGGVAEITAATDAWGGTWADDKSIIFTPIGSGRLWRVLEGGEPEVISTFDLKRREQEHAFPHALPGSHAVLFGGWVGASYGDGYIQALTLADRSIRTLWQGGGFPHFLPPGYLVFASAGKLMAAPFNPDTLEMGGSPVPVIEDLAMEGTYHVSSFALSANGTLAYAPGRVETGAYELVWIDLQGDVTLASQEKRHFSEVAISPDGRQAAYSTEGVDQGLWLLDLQRQVHSRFTSEGIYAENPHWKPDGSAVLFSSPIEGLANVFVSPARASGEASALLPTGEGARWKGVWSPDGRSVVVQEAGSDRYDLHLLRIGDTESRPFLATPANEIEPRFSPDGRWLAYISDASGTSEVYVSSIEDADNRVLISQDGGGAPMWSPDSRRLYFHNGRDLMAVDVTLGETSLEAGIPVALFRTANIQIEEISPDGRRFLGIRRPKPPRVTRIKVIFNWTEMVRSKLGGETLR